MVLLLNMTEMNSIHHCLLDKVREVVPPAELAAFHNFEALFQFLAKTLGDTEILVLQASSREELIDFKRIHDLMRDVQILLVIPDQKRETIFLAHHLHPRYLAYGDGNFDDLVSVLGNMLRRRRPPYFQDKFTNQHIGRNRKTSLPI